MSKVNRIYDWSPSQALEKLSIEAGERVLNDYEIQLSEYIKGVERPTRSGPSIQITSLEKQRIFTQVLHQHKLRISDFEEFLSNDTWKFLNERDAYTDYGFRNHQVDLSWKPKDLDSFVTKKMAGQKIIWMTEAGPSPFALISEIKDRGKNYLISYEHPSTGKIINQIVPDRSCRKIYSETSGF